MLVELEIAGESDKAIDKIDPVVAQIKEVQSANPDFYIGGVGVSTEKDVQEAFFEDLAKAGLISIPITLIILIVAFGALVAAGIPLLLGITAILATLGLISIWSQWLPMEEAVGAMVLLIGLAVGVDYSMFYLKREREERAKGRSEEAALEAAAATSGRSVLISGLTVLVAMSGMFLTGDATFASFGIATMTVVAIAMLGSLTVLPAVLSKLGDKVDRGRVPFVHRLSRKDGEGRFWGAIINRVLKRPVISVVLSAGPLDRACDSGDPAEDSPAELRHVSAEPPDDLQPPQGGVPRDRDQRDRRRQGTERRGAGGAGGNRPARSGVRSTAAS